ncbi:polysaccharide biosynthesis protein [alpha proteobacterium AAP81b]|nr:polysaccharide biosynthesis protein [alpha proteobacterium AAP81b]
MSAAELPRDIPEPAGREGAETAALARGGRTSFLGYVLRLAARFPFLFIAGRLYGAEALGRFAYATMVVELVAMLATLGARRAMAEDMARRGPGGEAAALADGLVLSSLIGGIGAALLIALPGLVFPLSAASAFDRWLPLIIVPLAACDVSLAALAFRHDIAATVRARALIEPWTLSLAALALAFTPLAGDGLIIAYVVSLLAAATAALLPAARRFGWPVGWRPRPAMLWRLARRNLPLAGADFAEWGARRLDIFILGRFASAEIVGIYYVAQQIASLPQRMKSSFDPILAPVLAVTIARGDMARAAAHLRQTSFWVATMQVGVVVSLVFTSPAGLGLFGPVFVLGWPVVVVLMTTELFAAQSAVAEDGLIYVARGANLAWSLAGLVVQLAVSLWLVSQFDGILAAMGAAAGLASAALFQAVAKTRLLSVRLGHPTIGWRPSLLLAAVPTVAAGWLVMQLPEWFQVAIGWVVIVAVHLASAWFLSFRGADRLLFARGLRKEALADADEASSVPAKSTGS